MSKAMIYDLGGSRSFGRLSLKAKVLWPMLLAACDDQGRGGAAPDEVTWYICPNVDEITKEDVPKLFTELEEQAMVYLYEDKDGEPLFQIVKWWKYQTPQWAQPSKYPAPDGWVDRVRYNVRGKNYVEENWNHPGGFASPNLEDEQAENPPGNPGENAARGDKVVESSIDKNSRTSSSSTDNDCNPFALYEDATASTLTRILADHIGDLIDECEEHRRRLPDEAKGAGVTGKQWVCAAIREASKSTNRFGIRYVGAILDRWREEGYESGKSSEGEEKVEKRHVKIRDPETGELVEVEAIA